MQDQTVRASAASRNARKFLIKNVSAGNRKALKYSAAAETELDFLPLDSSLSLWAELESKHLVKPLRMSGFVSRVIESDFDEYIAQLGTRIEGLGSDEVFCLFSDWSCVGVAILSPHVLGRRLSALMFASNDWLAIYSSDLSAALIVEGDRTGSGVRLNELSVSVLKGAWASLI